MLVYTSQKAWKLLEMVKKGAGVVTCKRLSLGWCLNTSAYDDWRGTPFNSNLELILSLLLALLLSISLSYNIYVY